MNPTRREFLGTLGAAACAPTWPAFANVDRDARHPLAKHVIFIHLAGSPSNLDLFDYKPALAKYAGQPCPPSLVEGVRFAFQKPNAKILPTPYSFTRRGESGKWVSELLPNIGRIVDKLTFVRSMHTEQFNHAPAQLMLHTGSPLPGRPSMGSWVSYGLGTRNPDLPAFVVMVSGGTPSAGKSVWGAGFLPGEHQGVQFRSGPDPVLFLNDPPGIDRDTRRATVDTIVALNRSRRARGDGDRNTDARNAQYELAFRMQQSVPEAVAIDRESAETLALYGAEPGAESFANHCLLARRLVERGVRFVQLYDRGWDGHGTSKSDDIIHQLPKKCGETDRAVAALIVDLERRGMLEDTIVVWSGEFGRTPMNEERNGSTFIGRDHHPLCFTSFVAGGGFRPGTIYGKTDEMGFRVVEDPVHVHDFQATLLHQLGLDHEKLTYSHLGRDFRLTDVAGHVVRPLLS